MNRTKKCLIIDDDPDDQEIFQMCLLKVERDVDCWVANTAIEAIAMLRTDDNFTPDFIFLDLNMPKMNGIDCLKELKKIKRLELTKIFMYSTTSEREVVNESKRLGAHDFLVKPSSVSVLREKLHHIFHG